MEGQDGRRGRMEEGTGWRGGTGWRDLVHLDGHTRLAHIVAKVI